jgi:hypothetical protein
MKIKKTNRPPHLMQPARRKKSRSISYNKKNDIKRHSNRRLFLFILLLGFIGFLTLNHVYAASASSELRSGVANNCLQADGSGKTDVVISVNNCNGSESQNWSTTDTAIQHSTDECLAVQNDGVISNNSVVMTLCANVPGQVWLRDQTGFINPNSGLCLSSSQNGALAIQNCNTVSQTQTWTPYDVQKKSPINTTCSNLPEGEMVACYAVTNWNNWQSPRSDHNSLLNTYSDGNGYESWCADFVSYIYKEARHQLTNGERNGWDEYEADLLQYDGFTVHMAGNYVPQTGDIAYFNYPGGHAEIVVSGGTKPTFIYGDSAQTDPQTGNGDMATNTITSDPQLGEVEYYLSPTK